MEIPRHGLRHLLAAVNGHRRGCQKTLVQNLNLLGGLGVGDQAAAIFSSSPEKGKSSAVHRMLKAVCTTGNAQLVMEWETKENWTTALMP